MLQIEYEITEQIHVTQDGVKRQKFVNTVTDLRVLFKKKKIISGSATKIPTLERTSSATELAC